MASERRSRGFTVTARYTGGVLRSVGTGLGAPRAKRTGTCLEELVGGKPKAVKDSMSDFLGGALGRGGSGGGMGSASNSSVKISGKGLDSRRGRAMRTGDSLAATGGVYSTVESVRIKAQRRPVQPRRDGRRSARAYAGGDICRRGTIVGRPRQRPGAGAGVGATDIAFGAGEKVISAVNS